MMHTETLQLSSSLDDTLNYVNIDLYEACKKISNYKNCSYSK